MCLVHQKKQEKLNLISIYYYLLGRARPHAITQLRLPVSVDDTHNVGSSKLGRYTWTKTNKFNLKRDCLQLPHLNSARRKYEKRIEQPSLQNAIIFKPSTMEPLLRGPVVSGHTVLSGN